MAQGQQPPSMLYGALRDDTIFGLQESKKRKGKEQKDAKKKDAFSPAADRIPLPPLPESVILERKALSKEVGKKVKIGPENPPSVCLYTVLNAPGGVCAAALSENCEYAAVGYGNSLIQVHCLNLKGIPTLKSSAELEQFELDADVDFSEDMYKSQERTDMIELMGHTGPVYSLNYSPDRRLLLSSSRDETVRLWSIEMRRNLMVYRMDAPVLRSALCPRGFYFAASTASKLVALYSAERIHPLRMFTDAEDDVTALDFHPNCNYVVGGSEDANVYVWDVLSGACVRRFSGHQSPVHSVKVSPCGRFVVSASTDGTLNVWDLGQQKLVCTQECAPMPFQVPIVFAKDSNVFAVGNPEFAVSFYNFDVVGAAAADFSTEQRTNPDGFLSFTYPTKRTALLDFHFSRKNAVVGIGAFEQ